MNDVVTRVHSTDGKVYLDPKLSGVGWFFCLDGDGPPELVIKAAGLNPRQARRKAMELVTELGLNAVVCAWPRRAVRSFVEEERLLRMDAYGFIVDLMEPIRWENIPADYRGLRPVNPTGETAGDFD